MIGIIFVLHGRKNKISTANLAVIEEVGKKLKYPYEIGLLEGEFQTFEDAVHSLLNLSVTKIVFLPVLLFPATHANEDIPDRAKKLLEGKLPYQILSTLGTTKAVERFIVEQIHSIEDTNAEVLLIAHGTSHYSEPSQQLEQIAQRVEQRVRRKVYSAGYYGEYSYQQILKEHKSSMIIQRLFLTEGYLAKKIKNELIEQRGTTDIFLPTMQNSAALVAAISERIEEIQCIQS